MEPPHIRQGYAFACLCCGAVWSDVYEIRRVHDSGGHLQAAYFLAGERTASPLLHIGCQHCGSPEVRVTAQPRGGRARADGGG